jgi:hypothetical protein
MSSGKVGEFGDVIGAPEQLVDRGARCEARAQALHREGVVAVAKSQNPLASPDGNDKSPVCTENLIRVDAVMESPKLAE